MEISVEITRKCNLRCLHCMRGEPQDVEISYHHLDIIVDYIESFNIRTLTLSGGEPFLAPEKIIYLFQKMLDRRLIPRRHMFTNGLVKPTDKVKEAVYIVMDTAPSLQAFLDEPISLSYNWFPDIYPEPLKFWQDVAHPSFTPEEERRSLLLQGRAVKNKKILESKGYSWIQTKEFIPSVYITARGRVVMNGDYEYANEPEGAPIEDKEQFERVLQAVQQNVFA